MTDTPSQEIIKKANKTATFTDSEGRVIVIKRLNAPDEYQFYRVIGNAQHNEGQAMTLINIYHVVSIDGQPIPKGTLLQLEATLGRFADTFAELTVEIMKLRAEDMLDAQKMQEQIKNLLTDQTS